MVATAKIQQNLKLNEYFRKKVTILTNFVNL